MPEHIYNLAHSFIKQEPKAAARLLEEQEPAVVAAFLSITPQNLAVLVIREMLPFLCARVLLSVDFSSAILWLSELTNNHACAIFRHMHKSKRDAFLAKLPMRRRSACQRLLQYNSAAIGAWVETEVPIVAKDMTVIEAIKRLAKNTFQEERLIIVVDEQRRPFARLSPLVLLRFPNSHASIESIAEPVQDVMSGWVTLSAAIGYPLWQRQDVIAVVDNHRELIGVISYSRVRSLLASQSKYQQPKKFPANDRSVGFLQAYGESMRAMIDTFTTSIR